LVKKKKPVIVNIYRYCKILQYKTPQKPGHWQQSYSMRKARRCEAKSNFPQLLYECLQTYRYSKGKGAAMPVRDYYRSRGFQKVEAPGF